MEGLIRRNSHRVRSEGTGFQKICGYIVIKIKQKQGRESIFIFE
jgi:hypothetical protein